MRHHRLSKNAGRHSDPAIILLAVKWRSARTYGGLWEARRASITEKCGGSGPGFSQQPRRQTFGVTCMQWALKTTPTGIVTAIIATTPVLLLAMTRSSTAKKSHPVINGSLIAVSGVIGLIALRHETSILGRTTDFFR